MRKLSMLSGLLAVGVPLVGMWAKKRMERSKHTKKGSFGGYSFTVKKDE